MALLRVSVDIPSEGQRAVCLAQECDCFPVSSQSKVGVALSTIGMKPINGLRHPLHADATGWYIWCGEEFCDAPDFFQALCVEHLLESLPDVADFLALPPGYRFLVHGTYRDVWFDEQLLKV